MPSLGSHSLPQVRTDRTFLYILPGHPIAFSLCSSFVSFVIGLVCWGCPEALHAPGTLWLERPLSPRTREEKTNAGGALSTVSNDSKTCTSKGFRTQKGSDFAQGNVVTKDTAGIPTWL